jgi:FtsZ-binding cell division protein ZapB
MSLAVEVQVAVDALTDRRQAVAQLMDKLERERERLDRENKELNDALQTLRPLFYAAGYAASLPLA